MQQYDASLRGLLHVLVNSPRPKAVARAIALGSLHSFMPSYVAIHAVVGDALELRCQYGMDPHHERLAARIPFSAPAPESAVAQTAQRRSLQGEEIPTAYPVMAHHDVDANGQLLCLPLLHEARCIGVLSVRLPAATARSWDDLELFDGVAAALALWLRSDTDEASTPVRGVGLRVTARQQRVLDGLRRGLTNGAIAGELGFAIGTIKADITAMSAVFGAAGREDLLRKAGRAGFSRGSDVDA